jgi:integrase
MRSKCRSSSASCFQMENKTRRLTAACNCLSRRIKSACCHAHSLAYRWMKANVRKGKFSQAEVTRLLITLPKCVADVAEFAYETGARAGEILKMRWDYLQGEAIEVPAMDTKNRKARSIVVTDRVSEIIVRRRKARVFGCDLVFHNEGHAIE